MAHLDNVLHAQELLDENHAFLALRVLIRVIGLVV